MPWFSLRITRPWGWSDAAAACFDVIGDPAGAHVVDELAEGRRRVAAPPADRHHRRVRRELEGGGRLRAVGRGRPRGGRRLEHGGEVSVGRLVAHPAADGLAGVASRAPEVDRVGVAPWWGVAIVAMQYAIMPAAAAAVPATRPAPVSAGVRRGRHAAATKPVTDRTPRQPSGPKWLWCNSTDGHHPPNASQQAMAVRPSHPDRTARPRPRPGRSGRRRRERVRRCSTGARAAHVAEDRARHHQPATPGHDGRALVASEPSAHRQVPAERRPRAVPPAAARRSRCPFRR